MVSHYMIPPLTGWYQLYENTTSLDSTWLLSFSVEKNLHLICTFCITSAGEALSSWANTNVETLVRVNWFYNTNMCTIVPQSFFFLMNWSTSGGAADVLLLDCWSSISWMEENCKEMTYQEVLELLCLVEEDVKAVSHGDKLLWRVIMYIGKLNPGHYRCVHSHMVWGKYLTW